MSMVFLRVRSGMDPVKIYAYLMKTRERVLGAVRPMPREQYFRKFEFGLSTIASTLTHIMISEWYYVERFEGREVRPYAEWPIKYETPPEFAVIDRRWREQAEITRGAIERERDWQRVISYVSFPDEQGRRFNISATAGDMFTQLALHETHHRSQVMAMIRLMGLTPVEDVDYNAMMFERRPIAS